MFFWIYKVIGIEYCLNIIVGEKDTNSFYEYILPERNYKMLHIMGDSSRDIATILIIEKLARNLMMDNNETLGIKVIISDKLKYKTYIALLNGCLRSDVSDWIPHGDTVFIFHQYQENYHKEFCQNAILLGLP